MKSKPIPDQEGYSADENGEIWSHRGTESSKMICINEDLQIYQKITKRTPKTVKLRGAVNGAGYRQYEIRGKLFTGHRLVFAAFHGDPGRQHVHHKDEDKLNNRPENLELRTASRHSKDHRQEDRVEGTCEICGKPFDRPRARKEGNKYCSDACNSTAFRRRHGLSTDPVESPCLVCGETVVNTGKKGRKKYCSRACKSLGRSPKNRKFGEG
jgi:endogenous inhibitor of DNA gyrase (YacG/DUF329 family)